MIDPVILLAEDALPTLSDRRAARVRWALDHVGLEPSDARYQTDLYPHDAPSRRRALALAQSGCGIADEAAWEAAGVRVQGYEIGYDLRATGHGLPVVTNAIDQARRCGAWHEPDPIAAALPLPGDALVMGCSSCPGVWGVGGFAGEHVSIVVATLRQLGGSAYDAHGVDGGQPGIHPRSRALVWCGRELWAASLRDGGYEIANGRPTHGRRVLGWIDADEMTSILAIDADYGSHSFHCVAKWQHEAYLSLCDPRRIRRPPPPRVALEATRQDRSTDQGPRSWSLRLLRRGRRAPRSRRAAVARRRGRGDEPRRCVCSLQQRSPGAHAARVAPLRCVDRRFVRGGADSPSGGEAAPGGDVIDRAVDLLRSRGDARTLSVRVVDQAIEISGPLSEREAAHVLATAAAFALRVRVRGDVFVLSPV